MISLFIFSEFKIETFLIDAFVFLQESPLVLDHLGSFAHLDRQINLTKHVRARKQIAQEQEHKQHELVELWWTEILRVEHQIGRDSHFYLVFNSIFLFF